MNKFDIIVSWPRNTDYPLWRQFIHDYRERFNLVVVVFTETNHGDDYRGFVRDAMAADWILFADSLNVPPGRDWRDVAIKLALLQSYNSQWVWFTEQDFRPLDGFWDEIEEFEKLGVRAIGVRQGERLHPCSLFMRRDLLGEIHKDFSANPPEYDHFGYIQKQLEKTVEPIGITDPKYWNHMNGLSHNMRLLSDGQQPNYEPNVFSNYLAGCLNVTVPLDPRFVALVKDK
jgi:hypothetical protein